MAGHLSDQGFKTLNVKVNVMTLTKQQKEAVERGEAVSMTVDGTECVLVKKDVYELVRDLIEEAHPRTMKRHLAKIMQDDWSDPAMNVYDQ